MYQLISRFLVLSAVLLCSQIGDAQSERSNRLFEQGVTLYQAGKYREAIPVFEECDSLDKAEMDSHKDKGWEVPQYWASFILLDALD